MSEQPPSPPSFSTSASPLPLPQNGVRISGKAQVAVHGDLIGGDKIVGYTSEQLGVLLTQLSASYQPKPFDGRSPYVGLASFQEEDADRFFGRETLTGELVARIENSRCVVIAGPSGSGKSSLARAGLLPALRRGALSKSEQWLYETLVPGRHPLQELGRVAASLTKSLSASDELQQRGREDPTVLHRLADIALGDRRTQRAVILVDQFEEIFTQVADETERASFLNLLTYAATVADGRVTIIYATRSDFIGHWAAYPNFNAQLSQGLNQIPPLQPDELVSAIARPALQVGLRIDPDLVKQILADMRDASGALPLMQFALDDLFTYAGSKGGVIALTLPDYLERGGLVKALERHADEEFAKLNADEQQVARIVFAGLVQPGRGTVDTKRTALFQELVPAQTDPARVQNVITKLADARLITTDTVNESETITLAHERLIDAWAWLRRLVDENRKAIALQNEIGKDAQEWTEYGRDVSYLYAGAQLATVQELLARRQFSLSKSAQEFVDAAVNAQEQARKREKSRTQRLVLAFAGAAVIFALLAIVAFFLRQQAAQSAADASLARNTAETRQAEAFEQKNEAERQQKIAYSRELAAVALNQLSEDPERAALLALEANRAAETFEAEDALRRALGGMSLLAVLKGHAKIVTYAEFSPDGKKIVSASNDGTARVWTFDGSVPPVLLRGHTAAVTFAEFSRDSRFVVTASADKTARIWDATTGRELFTLTGHSATVSVAHFSLDGSQVVTASADKTARLWDARTGKLVDVLEGHGGIVTDAEFSPDGAHIVTASYDKTARVWNASTGALEWVLGNHGGIVTRARFSPDGMRIATASADKLARLWNAANGEMLAELGGHEEIVRPIAFSPKGNLLVTGSNDGTARVWDALSGAPVSSLRGHKGAVYDATFSPDGKRILTAGSDGTARLWDVASSQVVGVLSGHGALVRSARFSPDGKLVVTASSDDTVRVWDASGGHEIATLLGHTGAVNVARFSADGTRIITASRDDTAKVWDTETGTELLNLKGHDADIIAAEFSSNGIVLTAGLDKTVHLWNATNGTAGPVLGEHTDILRDAHFSPDGKWVVTASSDKTARIWNSETGARRALLLGHTDAVLTASFSPDNQRIVTSGIDQTARVWDAATGKQLAILQGHQGAVLDAQFSPDGSRIVTAGDQTARIWDANTGALLFVLNHTENMRVARFSPDGKRIATAGDGGVVYLWDTASGTRIVELRGHAGLVLDVRWSPDGKWIASAGTDRTARLWDAATLQLHAVLLGHQNTVTSVAFSPDSSRIVTAGQDNAAREYFVNTADLIALANKRVTRPLACRERVQFLKETLPCPTPTTE